MTALPPGPPSAGRMAGLDALRGFAAMAVVFGHALHVLPQFGDRPWLGPALWWSGVLEHTPLFILVDGHAAVMVFFVLSGLVLARPLLGPTPAPYGKFLLKRVIRLYPPYAAALLMSALLQAALGHAAPHGPSHWLAQSWTDRASLANAADYAFMIGHAVALDNPVWSLDYEMRISILLPFLLLSMRVWGQRGGVALAVVLLFCGEVAAARAASPLLIVAARTAQYAGMFVVGALLSQNLAWLRSRRSEIAAGLLIAAAWIILGLAWRESVLGVGAALLVAAVIAPGGLARLCERPFPQFLGRISYSLYLVHVPLLMALLALTAGWVKQGLVAACLPPVAILVGWAFHLAIEAPSHRWAQRVRLNRPAGTPEAARTAQGDTGLVDHMR